jgi:hypothetical protein
MERKGGDVEPDQQKKEKGVTIYQEFCWVRFW